MSEKLKPCPFCYGVAEFERSGTSRQSTIVVCTECGARLETNETHNAGQEWNARSDAMSAAMTEAYYSEGVGEDDLKDCFRHHITTTISWLAFGARPGPEMQMYEEGFKAGYRRCQSDNELELGEEEDALYARARKLIGKLRESIKSGAVQLADVEDAVDLIIDQSAVKEEKPAYWVRYRVSDGRATFWETEVPDGQPLYRRAAPPVSRKVPS
jgi:hypothetical protein